MSLSSLVSKLSPKGEAGLFLQLASLVIMLFSAFFLLFIWVGNGILKLAMLFVGRKQEYRADQFAVKASFGIGLLSFLEKMNDFQGSANKGLLSGLYATHPPVMMRIDMLEKSLYKINAT